MPPKKKVDLPDHVRAAALADIEQSYRLTLETDENFKVQLYLKTEQGLTTHEMAEKMQARGLEVSQQTLSRWSRQGKEIYEARESARNQLPGEDPVRPGERQPVG